MQQSMQHSSKRCNYEEVKAIYDKYYADEKFVRVLEKDVVPETKWVEGSNYVDVNFKIDERTGIVMMGAIDNLVKGAAGQAVQNMNLMFGLRKVKDLTGSDVSVMIYRKIRMAEEKIIHMNIRWYG